MSMEKYDAIVVGAGHAGVESAHALAVLGAKTLLLALNLDSIAFCACNPSIGGTAKGNIVQEIDALGGLMGKIADQSMLHIRMLNEGKGPAVQCLRAQIDKHKYHENMKRALENTPNLTIKQGEVASIVKKGENNFIVTTTFSQKFYAKAVVVATGVYLSSNIIVGNTSVSHGPAGFCNATKLSSSLEKLGFVLRRFKTGTPPRVDAKTIDFSVFEKQPTDTNIAGFSAFAKPHKFNAKDCYLGYTTEETKKIIMQNLHRSPMYSGKIKGRGPRYCPSIEDKIVRFADKERHQIFLEPEADGTCEIYLQGLSTSFPAEIQEKIVNSVKGLENAKIMRNAYAIEYDCIDPTELYRTLESKRISGLFFAGQINGTSGYEEAAGQGILAGINAALKIKGKEQLTLARSESYIGVLVDDLVTKGTNEPYRMMTSRAEYRLVLRTDNAIERLMPKGRELGMIDDATWKKYCKRKTSLTNLQAELLALKIAPSAKINKKLEELGQNPITQKTDAEAMIKRGFSIFDFADKLCHKYNASDMRHEEVEIKYSGYIAQAKVQIEREKQQEDMPIPVDFDFSKISGLRNEAKQKLMSVKPTTVGQAGRISGVSPADITVLLIWLEKAKNQ